MENNLLNELETTLADQGPAAAIERLCATLRESKDYTSFFYALLLKKRFELGVALVPTGAALDLPEEMQEPYDEAIRQASRLVGRLYLQEGDIPSAWGFFRLLGEPEPVALALENYRPAQGEDCQPVIEIAFHQGVHPKKGFDLILEQFGICSGITMLGSLDFPAGTDVREYCIKRLVRALYQELRERLAAEILRKQGFEPTGPTVRALIQGRDWLFTEDYSHIDISHLSSVVQMATRLAPGEELELARELCEYGRQLSQRFQFQSDPPFENQYHDYGIYLSLLAGDQVEEGLAHFRAKVEEADPEKAGTYPAEVFVNLLLRLNRPQEALDVARRHLANEEEGRLACPSLLELCQRVQDYQTLAAIARERKNPVHFLAGLIAAKGAPAGNQ